jgi:selenocysteine lyase/cysteine desulfurase
MTHRRDFIRTMGAIAAGAITIPGMANIAVARTVQDAAAKVGHKTAQETAEDEQFWKTVRLAYSVSPTIINLNNGGVSPQPILVQDMLDKYNRMCNDAPSYYMWRELDKGREPLRERLAKLAGCDTEEVAINRNSTEALETIIFGLDLNEGDEVVLTRQDYPNMMNAWKQREMRDKIKLVWIDMDLPQDNDEYFVKMYTSAVTAKTRVVHITHMINWCGQMTPAKKIVDAVKAKNKNVFFIGDCAHSTALIDFKMLDLGVDAAGTSLHKWLCAPFGTGLLYVRKEKISQVWPLFPNDKPQSDDIRKFESLGTRSFPTEQAIGYALNFHETIGTARKQARLHYLKNYWMEKVKDLPKVKIHTSLKPEYSCAIGTFSIDGMKATEIDGKLFEKYKIHTVGIEYERFNHVRVTPNIYTSLDEMDKLVRAIKNIAGAPN